MQRHHRWRSLCLSVPLVLVLSASAAWSDTQVLYREFILSGGLYNGDFDLMRSHPQTSAGIDWLYKFSGEGGDWATAGLQARVYFDPEHDRLDPDLMSLWFSLRGDQGRANWQVGKFEIPYGLEPVLDTHGTLLQSNGHHNIGDLWSWGTAMHGQLDAVDYRLALLTGDFSEQLPQRSNDSWLLAGRVGSPRGGDGDAWGISLAAGRVVLGSHGEHVPRNDPHEEHDGMSLTSGGLPEAMDILRIGGDYTRWDGETTWYAEGSVGTDDGDLMGSLWLRWEYQPLRHERWTWALQGEGVWRSPDLQDDFIELSGQASYRINPALTARLLAGYAFDTITGDPEERLLFQLYYFGL